jgi:hypothetical protein
MLRRVLVAVAVSVSLVPLVAPDANAFIHEIIGAACRSGGEEVIPPGQVRDGMSFVRALQATGVIESIDTSVPGQVTIHFDPDKPASKFVSAGFDLRIEDGAGPGVDLILSPLIVPDEEFAAHAHCANLRA